jgi:hypothetical protein
MLRWDCTKKRTWRQHGLFGRAGRAVSHLWWSTWSHWGWKLGSIRQHRHLGRATHHARHLWLLRGSVILRRLLRVARIRLTHHWLLWWLAILRLTLRRVALTQIGHSLRRKLGGHAGHHRHLGRSPKIWIMRAALLGVLHAGRSGFLKMTFFCALARSVAPGVTPGTLLVTSADISVRCF